MNVLMSHGTTFVGIFFIYLHSNLLQIHLLEECGFHERAIEELYKKETKIVRIFI